MVRLQSCSLARSRRHNSRKKFIKRLLRTCLHQIGTQHSLIQNNLWWRCFIYYEIWPLWLSCQDVFVPGPSLRILASTRCQRTPLCHILLLNLDILQGSFRLCNWLSLRRLVSWINHLPPACWSTFRKSNSKQQLGCRFDIMDYES